MLGLEKTMMDIIQRKRVEETKFMRHWLWCDVWQNTLDNIPSAFAPSVTLIVYAVQATLNGKESIDTVQAFTTLSIIMLLTAPASRILGTIPLLASSISCFDRIQSFMVSSPRQDFRTELANEKIELKFSLVRPSSGSEELALDRKESELSSIRLVDISIRPRDSAPVILSNVNLTIPVGSLSIFIGAVGSGKTTLLRAILGEIRCESGTINVCTRRMAFCSQVPWLARGTIRNIVCGPESSVTADEDWYRACLHACALEEDLRALPLGDQTIIEGDNTGLSGGQKQRICLARAVYARPHIVILDDILSALDVTTQGQVVERLFGETGLFKKLRSSVLLVSHSCKFSFYPKLHCILLIFAVAEYLRFADRVYMLSDGTIHLQQAHKQSLEPISREFLAKYVTQLNESENTCIAPPVPPEHETPELDPLQDLKRKTGDVQVYLYYLKSFGWAKGTLFLFLVLSQAFCASFSSKFHFDCL